MNIKKILITGGAGFIGSQLIHHFVKKYPQYHIYNLDILTYAGNLENLKDIEHAPNYTFIKADIRDPKILVSIFEKEQPDAVIHLAAESHVDRSITNPFDFAMTNVLGTLYLLDSAKNISKKRKFKDVLFYQVSTDEVFGTLGETGFFTEETKYDPHSPYSASKASADHFVNAYHDTYGLPIIISNCSNNYGPRQFPEKLIPLCINNIIHKKTLPIYGDGNQVRDWLHVADHVDAIDTIFHHGKVGEKYNISGWNEWKNIDLVKTLCQIMDNKLDRQQGENEQLITFVKDRLGHDVRYAIDPTKLYKELGWKPTYTFEKGLEETVDWYLQNQNWINHIVSGDYMNYYQQQYGK
ncbi:MAG: dTDP-glucose 4,6-dehydratase [Chitinophagaceae bacterium]